MFCLWQAGVLFLWSSKHPANLISLPSQARSNFMSKIIFYSHRSQSAVRVSFFSPSVGDGRNVDDIPNWQVYYGDCREGVIQLNTAYISSDWGRAVGELTRHAGSHQHLGLDAGNRLTGCSNHPTHTHTQTTMWQLVSTWGLLRSETSFISSPELQLTWQQRFPHCEGFIVPKFSNNCVGDLRRKSRKECPSHLLLTRVCTKSSNQAVCDVTQAINTSLQSLKTSS